MKLEEFKTYQEAMALGEEVWSIVEKWDKFSTNTIGSQLVRAADSIAANLSEGLGRYHFNEAKHFSYYARGSLFETQTWLTKANRRKLIDDEALTRLLSEIKDLSVKLNNYIKSIGNQNNIQSVDNQLPDYCMTIV